MSLQPPQKVRILQSRLEFSPRPGKPGPRGAGGSLNAVCEGLRCWVVLLQAPAAAGDGEERFHHWNPWLVLINTALPSPAMSYRGIWTRSR